MKKLNLLTAGLLVVSGLLLASCGNKEAASPTTPADAQANTNVTSKEHANVADLPLDPAKYKLAAVQELTMNLEGPPSSLDPQKIADSYSLSNILVLFETLVKQDREGNFVPAAAASYETSEDGLTWTFKLRPEAKWSDGVPVKAADFEYAFKRLTDPATASPYGNYLELAQIKNAKAVAEGKADPNTLGVEAVDDYTLVLHLENPLPWLPQMLSLGVTSPVRKDVVEKYGESWTAVGKIVTNGPFLLESLNPQEKGVFVKNEGYWNASYVNLTKFTYNYIEDENASYLRFQAHDADVAKLPGANKEVALKDMYDNILVGQQLATTYFYFNVERVPDAQVRQAVKLLVNQDVLVKNVIKSGVPSSTLAPKYVVDGQAQEDAPYYSLAYDARVAQAKELLTKAGLTTDKPLELELLRGRSPASDKIAVALSEMVSKGSGGLLKLVDNPKEAKSYFADRNASKYDVLVGGWGADYNQASTFFDTFRCGNAVNSSKWCNKEYDALLDKAVLENDAAKRALLYAQAGLIFQAETPAAVIGDRETYYLRNPKVGGLNPHLDPLNPTDFFVMEEAPAAK